MAPTGILATQHYEELNRLFKDLPVRIALLTGRTTGKERELILQKAAHREVDILVGTHALIQDDVIFSDLALVVTDEQHRFGVRQRAALRCAYTVFNGYAYSENYGPFRIRGFGCVDNARIATRS